MPYGHTNYVYVLDKAKVSIPHMGCMPYGLEIIIFLIGMYIVSIPHMGCMPYGPEDATALPVALRSFNPSYGLHALRAVKCLRNCFKKSSFNPSYGLHALRAPGIL